MKQTHLLLSTMLLFSVLISAPLIAQNSTVNYDLSDYKLPYLKRHTLEFDFNMLTNYSSQNYQFEDNDLVETSNQEFTITILPRYNYYLNAEKFQITQSASANLPNISLDHYKNNDNNDMNFEMSPFLDYSGAFREYLKGKIFLEQDLVLNYRNSFVRSNDENINDAGEVDYINKQKGSSYEIVASIPILAGWGRIERVEDARLAVYILDDLNKAGKLMREVTQEDIHQLSVRISEVQNERMFDSREKKIWELQQINSFLLETGLIESEDIVYFTLLNDNWDYSAGPVRESGFRVSGGISPEIEFYKTVETEDEEYPLSGTSYSAEYSYANQEFGGRVLARLSYEKPLNLYWQLSISNEFRLSKSFGKTEIDEPGVDIAIKRDLFGLNNYSQIGFGFYPNSRTSMQIYASETVNFDKYTPEDDDETKWIQSTSTLGFSFNYYISPRIRLGIGSRLYYRYINQTPSEYHNNNFDCYANASLVYKLL